MKKRFKVLLLSLFCGCFIFKESSRISYDFFGECDDCAFDYFKGINIYFVDSFDDVRDDDNIYVIDFRDDDDPNLVVSNSYKIRELEMINWVLKCLKMYDDMYPSLWDRSFNSMEYEWLVHNFGYDIGFLRDSCKDVDFNNYDEGKVIPGLSRYLKK